MKKILLFIIGILAPQLTLCNTYDTATYAFTDLTTIYNGINFTEKVSSSFIIGI